MSPDTEHTALSSEPTFLHIRVALESSLEQQTDVFLADVSGETFEEICNGDASAETADALRRADHVSILLDGALLQGAADRHEAEHWARQLVRRISESQLTSEGCRLQLCVSKMDMVHSGGTGLLDSVRELSERIAANAAEFVEEPEIHYLAARPEGGVEPPTGSGLPKLLKSWLAHYRPMPI